MKIQEFSETIVDIVVALGCSPELEGKTLLLEIQHTLVIGLGRILLELI